MNNNKKLTQEEKKISDDLISGKYKSLGDKKRNEYLKQAKRQWNEKQNKNGKQMMK